MKRFFFTLALLIVPIFIMAFASEAWEILYSMDFYNHNVFPKKLFFRKGWVMYGISDREFYVFDISSLSRIELIKKFDLSDYLDWDNLKAISGDDKRLYILYDHGVFIYDISIPNSPKYMEKKKFGKSFEWLSTFLDVDGKLIAGIDTNLLFLDLSKNTVKSLTKLPYISENMQYSKEKSLLVIPTSKGTAFLRLDLSSHIPIIEDKVILGDNANYIWIDKNRVYSIGDEYLDVFDISNPTEPKLVKRIDAAEIVGSSIKPYLPSVFARDDVVGVFVRDKSSLNGLFKLFDMADLNSPKVLATKSIRTEVLQIFIKGNLVYFINSAKLDIAKITYNRERQAYGEPKEENNEYNRESSVNVPSELIECKAYFIFSQLKRGTDYKITEFIVYNHSLEDRFKLFSLTHPGEIKKFVSYSPTRLCVRYEYEQDSIFGMNGMIGKCWKCKQGILYKIVVHPSADDPKELIDFLPKGAY